MSEQQGENEIDYFDVTEESFSNTSDADAATDTPQTESSTETEDVEIVADTADAEQPEQEVTTEAETAEEETETVEETPEGTETEEATDPDLLVEQKDKDGKPVVYDFSSAPKPMREIFKTSNKVLNAFIRDDAEAVLSELEKVSPSSYLNLTQRIVNECASANPKGWADYLVKADPALVAQTLLDAQKTETDDFTGANPALLAELFRIYREESSEGEDLRFVIEARDSSLSLPTPPKLDPAEKAELEQLRAEAKAEKTKTEADEVKRIYEDIWTHIEDDSVVPIIKKLGLMPSDTDSEEDLREKKRIIDTLPAVLDKALRDDPEISKDYEKFFEKVKARDKAGAMALTPSIREKVESEVNSYLGFFAKARTQATKQKFTAAKTPPKVLASVGAIPAPVEKAKPLNEMLDSMSDEEFLRNMGQI